MGRPTGSTAHSAADVISAIRNSGGVKATIAKKLGVTRQTVNNYLDRWVTVKEAYEEEKARVDDVARSVVINDIAVNRSVETAKWWLRMKNSDEFSGKVKAEIVTWKDEVVEALKRGEIEPAAVREAYPDLAADFFRRAGVNVD